MKALVIILSLFAALSLFSACGSGDNQVGDRSNEAATPQSGGASGSSDREEHGGEHMKMEQGKELPSRESWVRSEPIDVNAIDVNRDGFVYQDKMDWNVIADEEGRCPTCGMFLKKVTIADAVRDLRDNGFETIEAKLPEETKD
jgi:hypothetical protein